MALGLDPGGRTRFAKISMAIIDELTQVYRDLLQRHVPANHIFNKVKASQDVFKKLSTDQILILKDACTNGYADFDITLMYTLLRNVCTNIPAPTKKWGTPPGTGEVGIGDDIERVRIVRNKVHGHVKSASMSKNEFEDNWRMISDICRRLQSHTGGSYTSNLQNILERTIDEDQERRYIEKLKFDSEKDKSVLEELSSLKSDVQDLKSKMTDLYKWCWQLIFKVNVLPRNESTEAKDNVDRMMETLKKTLNRMVDFIDKETKVQDISRIEDNITAFLDSSGKEDIVFLNDLLDKFEEKIELAFNDQNDVRIGIMSRFAHFVIIVKKKYQAKFSVDIGSLIITFHFESLQGFQKFKEDWKSCLIQEEVKKVVHCEPFLRLFMIKKEDMKVELEECTDMEKDEGEDIQGERVKKKEMVEKERKKEDTTQRKDNFWTRGIVRLRNALSTPYLVPIPANSNPEPEGEEIQEERMKKVEKKRRKEDTRERKGNIVTRSLVRLRHAFSTPNLAIILDSEPSTANSSPETSRAHLDSGPNITILDSEPSTANSSPGPRRHNSSPETSGAHLSFDPSITILSSEPSTTNSSPEHRRASSSPETSKAHLVSNPSITILSSEPSTANPSLITAHLIPEPSTINQWQLEENEGFNLSASPLSVGKVSPPPTMTNLIFEPTIGNLSPKPVTTVPSPTLTTVNSSPTITTVNSSPLPTIASLNPGPIPTRPRLRPLVKIGGSNVLASASPISRPVRAKPIPKYITTNLPPRPTTAKLGTKYTTSNPSCKPATANLSIRQWVMIGGIKISVVEGQLIDEQVDVYVNGVHSSFDLSRIPSKKLSDAAGPALEADCKKRFPNGLKIGDIADTGGFNSNCQRVYHVTLPRSQQDGSQNKNLTQSVKDCLERANKNSFTSIAVPDLGSPIGYPPSILADLMFTAVEEFSKGKTNPNLSQVVFSIFKNQVYTAFVNKAKEIYRQKSVISQKKKFKFGRVEVWLEVGDLTQQHVDVIVCSGPKDLRLKNKGMAETMLMAAGPKLQKDCDDKYPNGIKHGDIAITGGHDLHCRFVYIGALPKWGTSTKAKQILKDLVINCLDEANKHPMTKTLAFPTLGTGSLEYPPDEVAEVMAECIKDFNKKYPKTELTRITIVAYNLDKKWQTVQQSFKSNCYFSLTLYKHKPVELIQSRLKHLVAVYTCISVFSTNANTQSHCGIKGPAGTSGTVVTHKITFKLGRIDVWLKVGNLTEQQVDVIVCSGPKDLKLKNKGMAETMLMAAGSKLQKDCDDKYPNGIQYGDIAITGGHDLHCQFVYHGALPKWGTSGTSTPKQILKDFVTNCLEEANKHPMTKTLAFPTLGTGSLEYPPDEVAEVMAECIEDFNKKYPKTELTRITIVVYSMDQKWQTVQQAFRSALQIFTPTRPVSSKTASSSKPLNSKQYFEDLYHKKPMPPSYWTKYTSSKTLADWNTTVSQKAHEQVDLNPSNPIYKAIKKLALTTWKSQYVGHGVDSAGLAGLNYTNIRITGIKRLENPHLFEEYWKYREKLFLRASKKGVLKPLQQISQAKNGEVLTTKMADPLLKTEIYPGINEHYLFHGTEKKYIENILTQGLDGRLANSPFFGKGVYCAESSTKSDQYADPKQNRDLQEKQMLLVRACLGEIFVRTDTTTKHNYSRPPCQCCHDDRCTDVTHSSLFFDSIVVDGGWNFREFIVYDNKACYPEYLISYKRI
ncbi:uncharacterized protein LOC134256426 [Saccostrea cucullata]|uniref:uncharacterized protein LOC134256426 n=1 Tax=Saccostrea cuccullata TaxID=36930 RepID=UPI002ED3EF5B